MKTDMLREDHQDLLKICQQVESICSETLSSHHIESILPLMKELLVQLEVHLVCEDKYLYPYLLQLEHDSLNKVASKFKREMGGLNDTLHHFFAKWCPKNAYSNKVEFVCELCDLVGDIRTRIRKEETVLFPLMGEGDRSQHFTAA